MEHPEPPQPRLTPLATLPSNADVDSKTSCGSKTAPEINPPETVTDALRRTAFDGDSVTLAELAQETDLTPIEVEQAMCNIERVAPVSTLRLVETTDVAWTISL